MEKWLYLCTVYQLACIITSCLHYVPHGPVIPARRLWGGQCRVKQIHDVSWSLYGACTTARREEQVYHAPCTSPAHPGCALASLQLLCSTAAAHWQPGHMPNRHGRQTLQRAFPWTGGGKEICVRFYVNVGRSGKIRFRHRGWDAYL